MDIIDDLKFHADVANSLHEGDTTEEPLGAIYMRAIGEIRSLRDNNVRLKSELESVHRMIANLTKGVEENKERFTHKSDCMRFVAYAKPNWPCSCGTYVFS